MQFKQAGLSLSFDGKDGEAIPCVTAWCATENDGSQRALKKTSLKLVDTEKDDLAVEDRVYDKPIYEYRK